MSAFEATMLSEPALHKALSNLAQRLGGIGLSLAVYDPVGEPLLACVGAGEVCQRFCGRDGPCQLDRYEAVKEVWAEGKPRVLRGQAGCVLLALPVLHRRRMVGVAMACYLASDAGTHEEFIRACDRMHLDRAYLAGVVQAGVTHPADEAPYWMDMLQMLLAQSVENAVARSELASFSSSLGSTYEELSLLYRLSGAMKLSTEPAEFFRGVCRELLEVMEVESAVAAITEDFESDRPARVVRAGEIDISDERLQSLAQLLLDEGLAEENGRGVVVNRSSDSLRQAYPQVRNYVAVPLVSGDLSMGLLMGINKAEGEFDSADLKLIHSVGVQVAGFLANNNLYDSLQELLMGVLHVLTASIDAKDQYTCGHSQRVAMISRKLAEMCQFSPQQVENIYLSGLLHDMGKIGVPETVLCKPGKLTREEFEMMKRHPVIGANILTNIRQMKVVIPGVLYHHERMDGRGYPDGLTRDEVPMEGRIVGLADSFDAMTSSRTYRYALPLGHVVAEIIRYSGTQFDPDLVDHLLTLDLPEFLAELRRAKPMVSSISGTVRPGERETARGTGLAAAKREGP